MMKKLGRWAARTLGTAVAVVLVIVLLPWASRLAQMILPDLGNRAVNASVLLSEQLTRSARLETTLVEREGVLSSSTDALLLGTVQQVTVHYTYQASIGIDLARVELIPRGNTLTMVLPEPEVLVDSITQQSIDRDDFWYPLTDKQLQRMMEEERLRCREDCIARHVASDTAWDDLCRTMDQTVSAWLQSAADGLTVRYEKAADAQGE